MHEEYFRVVVTVTSILSILMQLDRLELSHTRHVCQIKTVREGESGASIYLRSP
jgi:hypothetical protein